MQPSPQKSPFRLAEEVQVFFRKGAHDMQNVFQMMKLCLNTESISDKEQTISLLHELQMHYTDEISRLRQAFDELLSVQTNSVTATRFGVTDLVETVLAEMLLTEDHPTLRVEKEFDPTVQLVFAQEHLKNALRVLLDNGLRYRMTDRPLIIKLQVVASQNGAILSVADNGQGIDMTRYAEQVFAPFVRCTSQEEGQGISLHLVKMMVEKYGGQVSLDSEVGQGTTVSLSLVNQAE